MICFFSFFFFRTRTPLMFYEWINRARLQDLPDDLPGCFVCELTDFFHSVLRRGPSTRPAQVYPYSPLSRGNLLCSRRSLFETPCIKPLAFSPLFPRVAPFSTCALRCWVDRFTLPLFYQRTGRQSCFLFPISYLLGGRSRLPPSDRHMEVSFFTCTLYDS